MVKSWISYIQIVFSRSRDGNWIREIMPQIAELTQLSVFFLEEFGQPDDFSAWCFLMFPLRIYPDGGMIIDHSMYHLVI
jgi:hypothetical protein